MKLSTLYTTIGTQAQAEALAKLAVENDLAKCVNIVANITSIYRWNHKIEKESECTLLFKTSQNKIKALRDFIQQNHPYETPAILESCFETTPEYFAFIEDKPS